ncbi:hypothetical protein [Catellatospora sichuanensis]|uniref:hypothetical protein n=1 Tax=Catellatospora sichuanensis TaxID=1969805 RepID=UPI0011820893|nr:hypothetical protein [Catellatospora sichuanensis]
MADEVPSARLLQVLKVYCESLDPIGISDLQLALRGGRHPWLRDELRQVLGLNLFTEQQWTFLLGEAAGIGRAQRREMLWTALFPSDPMPKTRSSRWRPSSRQRGGDKGEPPAGSRTA